MRSNALSPVLRFLAPALLAGLLSACAAGSHEQAEYAGGQIQLEQLPGTAEFGGSAGELSLSTTNESGRTVAELRSSGASSLKTLYVKLSYDARSMRPLLSEASPEFAAAGKLIELAVPSEPGTLNYGAVVALPQEPTTKGYSGSGVLARFYFENKPEAQARQLSSAPATSASSSNLTYDEGSLTFDWGYRSQGDYDQNGLVGISDLTPIGVHFGADVPPAGPDSDPDSIEAVVDGDGNGLITIADLTPIGQNFGNSVAEYRLYAASGMEEYPAGNTAAETSAAQGVVPFSAAIGSPSAARLRFTYTLPGPAVALFFVRPVDSEGNPGTPSTIVDLTPGGNTPPTVGLGANITLGIAPLNVTFVAEATDLDGDSLEYSWDFDGNGSVDANSGASNSVVREYSVSGQYTARVIVSDGTNSSEATLGVSVQTPSGNIAPRVFLEADVTGGFGPLLVNFTATVIDPDPGQTLSFDWDWEGDFSNDLNTGSVNTASNIYSYDEFWFGSYSPRVVVSDGFDSAEASTSIFVNPPDNPPTFDFFEADVTSGSAPLTVTFSAGASDIDGDPVSYLWDFEGTGGFVPGSEVAMHTYTLPGVYNAFVRAEDGIEGTTSSAIVITVNP